MNYKYSELFTVYVNDENCFIVIDDDGTIDKFNNWQQLINNLEQYDSTITNKDQLTLF